MDDDKGNAKEDEELRRAIAAMSDEEKVKFWVGMFDTDMELGKSLFFGSLLQDADADYKTRLKEDHPKARFSVPRQPPALANKTAGSPPVTAFSGFTVLALCASGAPPQAGGAPNIRAPSTIAAVRAAQGKTSQCTPIAPRRAAQDHTHARPLVQKPPQPPSTSETNQSPPQNSFKTVTAVCAPPSTTAAARASQGKKPQCTPITPRHAVQDHTHLRPLVQKPPQPTSTSEPNQAPPQNSYKTVTVLCAPPHLAGGLKRPSASTECAPQGKKQHLAV